MLPEPIKNMLEANYEMIIKHVTLLGQGSNGSVYKVESEDGRVMCLKAIGLGNPSANTEIEIASIYYRQLGFATRNFKDDNFCYVTTPFYTGEHLGKIIAKYNTIPVEKREKIFLKLAEVVDKMHNMGILHRDLKAENILIENTEQDPQVHIIDFGRSVRIFDNETGKPLSTPELLSLYHTNAAWYSFFYPLTQLARWMQPQTAPEYKALTSHQNGFNYEAENVGLRSDYYSLAVLFQQLIPEKKDMVAKIMVQEGLERSRSFRKLVRKISDNQLIEPADNDAQSQETRTADAPSP